MQTGYNGKSNLHTILPSQESSRRPDEKLNVCDADFAMSLSPSQMDASGPHWDLSKPAPQTFTIISVSLIFESLFPCKLVKLKVWP